MPIYMIIMDLLLLGQIRELGVMIFVVSIDLDWVPSHGLSRADPTSTHRKHKIIKEFTFYYW